MSTKFSRKIAVIMAAVLTAVMLFLPALAVTPTQKHGKITKKSSKASKVYFNVLISDTGEIEKISCSEYIFGVVASEMGADYPTEALKAQAVASYTFALYRKEKNKKQKYDITDSPDTDQKYRSRADLEKSWGDNAEKYSKKIDGAISEAIGYVMTDSDGKPILAAYHAVSAGRTESAENVWGSDIPYLCPVESIGDLLSPDYLSVRTFTEKEVAEKLSDLTELTGDAALWLGAVSCTDSGTVMSASFAGKQVTGAQLQKRLGLRSAAFDISYKDGLFTFNVKGWGHGVGMSQYGAKYLASTGSTFVEILSHYYTGCKMVFS